MFLAILKFIVTIILLAVQDILSTELKNPLWGGLIWAVVFAFTLWCFVSGYTPLELKFIFGFSIMNLLFVFNWVSGREKYKKKYEDELTRMKAMDI